MRIIVHKTEDNWVEEQFPAFTVDERACSDPCQIEAQRITVQHESKQNNRIGKKMLEV